MKNAMWKRVLGVVLVLVLALGCLAGCGTDGEKNEGKDGKKTLKVGVIDASIPGEMIWVADKEGIFDKYGVDVEITTFTNGMVMMEAIDTIDVAMTGVGGILAGMINYDTQLFSVIAPDSGTQYLYVRKDSDIAKAGKGHNTVNPEIYGDAQSWKGAEVLSTNGNVLQYLLIKVLDGFGLTLDDVNVTWMDMPTCNASFLAGEGDAATVTGTVSYSEDKKDYVVAATGAMCDLGLNTCMLADPDKIEDDETREAMVAFVKACFESVNWIQENKEAAEEYMQEWSEYCGQPCTPELAEVFLQADPYYSLDEVHTMMTTEKDGHSLVEAQLSDIFDFYVDCGNYTESDREKLMNNKFTTEVINEVYETWE